MPSPSNPPTGCPFHPRCPLARTVARQCGPGETVGVTVGGKPVRLPARCVNDRPPLEPKGGDPAHVAACWYTD